MNKIDLVYSKTKIIGIGNIKEDKTAERIQLKVSELNNAGYDIINITPIIDTINKGETYTTGFIITSKKLKQ